MPFTAPTFTPLQQGQSPRDEHYAAAAHVALQQASRCRDDSLRRCSHWDRRIDRTIMRQFAMEWRDYTRLARRFA